MKKRLENVSISKDWRNYSGYKEPDWDFPTIEITLIGNNLGPWFDKNIDKLIKLTRKYGAGFLGFDEGVDDEQYVDIAFIEWDEKAPKFYREHCDWDRFFVKKLPSNKKIYAMCRELCKMLSTDFDKDIRKGKPMIKNYMKEYME